MSYPGWPDPHQQPSAAPYPGYPGAPFAPAPPPAAGPPGAYLPPAQVPAGAPVWPPARSRTPGSIALGAAVSVVLSAGLGILGMGLIVALAYVLRSIRMFTGDSGFLGVGSDSTGIGGNAVGLVVLCAVLIVIAVVLGWGAISAITGSSIATGVTGNVLAAIVILIGVVEVHPLLLSLLLLPVVAVIALLSPTSKAHVGRP